MQAGEKINRLTLINPKHEKRSGAWHGLFKCECGNEKSISISNVVLGKSKSCGCILKENPTQKTHGMSKTKIYATWNRMLMRCTNPSVERYPRYGGRGIKVCDRWKSFENFYEDMGDVPNGCSLGRIDNDGNYEPSNVRWETDEQQRTNMSINVFVEFDGENLTLAQWSKKLNIDYSIISQRHRAGISPPELFGENRVIKEITVDGVTKLTTEWLKFADIPISSFYYHQRRGLSKEDIIKKYLTAKKL